MVDRLISRTVFNSNTITLRSALRVFGNIHCNKLHSNEVSVKEIRIPTKWGHIAAKLWGSDQSRPILALHGWQDNAGTWDPLAPMLIKNRSILALDFPGHGLSSWIPPGTQYYSWELPRLILYLKGYFKWDKVSLLCHSMGSIAGLRYSCLYPDDVDFYVAIENLIHEQSDLDFMIERYPKLLEKGLLAQTRLEQEPPCYSLEEITKIWHLGTNKSVALENVQYLLKRGAKQSKHDANKYHFTRDSRLKCTLFNPEDKKFVEAVIKRIKCPTLHIKAIDSPYASDAFSEEMRKVIEKNNDKFESHFIPGTHHVHLNNPEKVAPLIINFLQKYNIPI